MSVPSSSKQGPDDVLFDIDFLNDPPATESHGEQNTPEFLIHDETNRYNANYLLPQETIDLNRDESIENDVAANPFMDDTAATWNDDFFNGASHGSRLKRNKSTRGGNFISRAFGRLRDRIGKNKKRYQSFEMTNYNDRDNHDNYEKSRNMFDIKVLFNHYILRKPLGNENDGGPRLIHLNDSIANGALGYGDNHISTTKYNAATFLPKFLFQEFSKYANLFFLFTSIIQQVPHVSPTNRYTTLGTLMVVLVVSAIKECVEDIKRVHSDNELNNAVTEIYSDLDGGFIEKRWIDVRVGDIVKVKSEEAIPADMIILSSSEPEGLCYIETANLDGETNLKIKQARVETSKFIDAKTLGDLHGEIRSEQPNSSLYTYEATMILNGQEIPLVPDQMILRGATLRNTAWMFGIVVFTGHETKLMRNATATPIKRTAVERIINLQITVLFGVLIVLSLISALGNVIMSTAYSKHLPYLYLKGTNKVGLFFRDLLTFWILFSNLVPISLFVTVEVIKYYQAFMIGSDLDLYDEETDTPTVVRTSSLVEELGQIEYIFSDKTGTLTRNVMEFKSCSIAGRCYIETIPEDKAATYEDGIEVGYRKFDDLEKKLNDPADDESPLIKEFLTLLATCHTVIPEFQSDGSIKYQAASPDEGALVEGGAYLGYKFLIRKPSSVIVQIEETGEEKTFELLKICEFNSSRKRMSTIFRTPDGSIKLYCKGADTVIMERLASDNNPYVDSTVRHLEEYASEGFRTLCLAMRDISDAEYSEWSKIYESAATSLEDRQQKLDDAAELIEKDLILLGATAIEDKLQDGVPETIHTLQEAGLKIWVLTGDRQETAINIGMSCRLLSEDMNLLMINEDSKEKTSDNMIEKLDAINEHKISPQEMDTLALVIDGKSLEFALEPDLEDYLLALGKICKAVICCRVSPLQKALVVKMVKRKTSSLLLAIGDGANDVSMIQAAHVGVGISGKEGMQAARSADFAIGQFKYLKKLLLVHGSWSYQRISVAILYSFYKNIALYMTQFWFGFSNAFSGQSIMESWTLTFYNVFFTVLPPFVIGVFDQFVSSRLLERYPQLYKLGQKGQFFSVTIFWGWIMNGFYHSAVIYVGSILFYRNGAVLNKHGEVADHWSWGVAVYTTSVAIVLGKAALVTNQWTKFTIFAIPGSFIFWIVFFPIYATIFPHFNISREYYGVVSHTYSSATFWLMLIVLPVFALMRDFLWKYYRRMYVPQAYHVVQEMQKFNISDYRPHVQQFQSAIRKVRQVQRMKKQRGFAFSQSEQGGQERIVRMYDTTQKRGIYGELHDASANPFSDDNYVNIPSNPFSDENQEPALVDGNNTLV
ncbi:ZYBA0S07-04434g1_1 [Zygosaccharomyces bailii CLIB 213]|uniref:Phospholipid-transporting ATPase n=1 Tax=Zygosaccharomyces bailii (strain CLIB 213 / ATCC 58445 / CBS 680 / BCRC 21525 / NBRC 1098 / NCYC 1416 / NRRL Y-2227) TaxID=1333698 RepID=A0A8J2X9D9_ZYGB2|nr:ZYBA0S07-04434g1_1 [Zygosaccharomyces bailii CLIB 213]